MTTNAPLKFDANDADMPPMQELAPLAPGQAGLARDTTVRSAMSGGTLFGAATIKDNPMLQNITEGDKDRITMTELRTYISKSQNKKQRLGWYQKACALGVMIMILQSAGTIGVVLWGDEVTRALYLGGGKTGKNTLQRAVTSKGTPIMTGGKAAEPMDPLAIHNMLEHGTRFQTLSTTVYNEENGAALDIQFNIVGTINSNLWTSDSPYYMYTTVRDTKIEVSKEKLTVTVGDKRYVLPPVEKHRRLLGWNAIIEIGLTAIAVLKHPRVCWTGATPYCYAVRAFNPQSPTWGYRSAKDCELRMKGKSHWGTRDDRSTADAYKYNSRSYSGAYTKYKVADSLTGGDAVEGICGKNERLDLVPGSYKSIDGYGGKYVVDAWDGFSRFASCCHEVLSDVWELTDDTMNKMLGVKEKSFNVGDVADWIGEVFDVLMEGGEGMEIALSQGLPLCYSHWAQTNAGPTEIMSSYLYHQAGWPIVLAEANDGADLASLVQDAVKGALSGRRRLENGGKRRLSIVKMVMKVIGASIKAGASKSMNKMFDKLKGSGTDQAVKFVQKQLKKTIDSKQFKGMAGDELTAALKKNWKKKSKKPDHDDKIAKYTKRIAKALEIPVPNQCKYEAYWQYKCVSNSSQKLVCQGKGIPGSDGWIACHGGQYTCGSHCCCGETTEVTEDAYSCTILGGRNNGCHSQSFKDNNKCKGQRIDWSDGWSKCWGKQYKCGSVWGDGKGSHCCCPPGLKVTPDEYDCEDRC